MIWRCSGLDTWESRSFIIFDLTLTMYFPPRYFSSSVRRHKGFTLIELLVVLVILTLLAGLVGPRVMKQLGGAKSKTAALQIADLEKSIELFKLDVGRSPNTKEGPDALAHAPASISGWNGPYIKGNLPNGP